MSTLPVYPNCLRCGRQLKNPKSVIRGYGRTCFRKKFGMSALEMNDEDFALLENEMDEGFDFLELSIDEMLSLTELKPITISGEGQSRKVFVDMLEVNPYDSFKVKMHSPDGFNWGYSGSGPAQLALAIILLYVQDEEWIYSLYQDFKFEIIAGFPKGKDFIVRIDIGKWFLKKFYSVLIEEGLIEEETCD